MERIKRSAYGFVVVGIALFLFFMPFGWLKPGEMDLGGDSSRLYFYDPVAYLTSQSLYSVTHSGLGAENLSFYGIPFFLLLALVQWLVRSPTHLISLFHGLNMSVGFLSCYAIVKELLGGEEDSKSLGAGVIDTASILAGLFYSLAAIPIGWWSYPLLTMNQVSLNPLLFYLLLRFFLTASMRYVLAALLLTVPFAVNFSFVGAPTFFAFFPLAGLFLLLYTKYIRRRPIPIIKLVIGLFLFILLQAFHLFPQMASILTPGSVANETVFGALGKFEWGLKYFLGTAPLIKVSNSFLGLPQIGDHALFYPLYAVFPFIMVLALLWNKRRTYLLSLAFFLVALFFVTANITTLGFRLYTFAFRLPGFSMFRVFYGQWQWSYMFFFTIAIGLALAIVFSRITRLVRMALTVGLLVLFGATSWPLITGKLTDTTHWQSKRVKSRVKIDPSYPEVLAYLRSLPIDGKILTFPLNDHGYQVLKGENDAAYEGPSTITYLAARNEFNGIAEFGVFDPAVLSAARERNFAAFREIMTILNIRYIFYNEDPFIYTNNFPGLPYTRVRNYFPDTQEGYKAFIEGLGVKEIKTVAGKYHVYEVEDRGYVPHVYAPKRGVYWGDRIAAGSYEPLSFYATDKAVALFDDRKILLNLPLMFDDVLLKARNVSTLFDFFVKKKEDRFVSPTVSRLPSSFVYPLVVIKERLDLGGFSVGSDAYIDRSIYFAEKRINELTELEEIPLRGTVSRISTLAGAWKEPSLLDVFRWSEYNSWETVLVRYFRAMERLIADIERTTQSKYSVTVNKATLKGYFGEHKSSLRAAIRKSSRMSRDEKKYLSRLVEDMYLDLGEKLNQPVPDIASVSYAVAPIDDGSYDVYVKRNEQEKVGIALVAGGKSLREEPTEQEQWSRFEDISVEHTSSLPITLSFSNMPNLVSDSLWRPTETVSVDVLDVRAGDNVTFSIPPYYLADTSGIIRDIPGWESDSVYVISFDYNTDDTNFAMIVHEKGGAVTNKYSKELYRETIRSSGWKQYRGAVLSSKDANAAALQIVRDVDDYEPEEERAKRISIKNVSVQKMLNPAVVLKRKTLQREKSVPTISFQQVNPVKYMVRVANATDPYILVLSQAFHPKWKLFLPTGEQEAKTVRSIFVRPLANALGALVAFFTGSSPARPSPVVAIYGDGAIREEEHGSIFLAKDTFDTWGQDPVAEGTHVTVNGYANAWFVRPEDVGGRAEYMLTIEMTSQKIFYGSLFLSVAAFASVVVLFLFSLVRVRV